MITTHHETASKMKKITYLCLLLFLALNLTAQVGINTDNSDPDVSAMLDVKSDNKGILVPRMTTSQRTMINNAATGLLVFDTDTESFWFKDTNGWVNLVSGNVSTLADDDDDTKIQVQKNVDDDMIRFDINGSEVFTMYKNAFDNTLLLEPKSTIHSTVLGNKAGRKMETGQFNTFIGELSGFNTTSGNRNTFLGYTTGSINTTGNDNVYIGEGTGQYASGSKNVLIGARSGTLTQGSSNIFLGYRAGYAENGSNKLYIENSNATTPLIYGEFDNDLLRVNGTLNISSDYALGAVEADSSAVVDIQSTTKGFLIPRMTTIQRDKINNAATGLLVFDTDTESFWFKTRAIWIELVDESSPLTHDDSSNLVKPDETIVDISTDDFVFGSTQLEDSGNTNHDSRFFFDKSKGAFRAGIEDSDRWDDAKRGIGSVALGEGNTASGKTSVAMGYQSGATGDGAVAIGNQSGALGNTAVAIGNRNVVDTDTAFAIGSYNYADKDYALAIGTENEAQEIGSTAIGFANLATAEGASAFGEFNEANGLSSLALGSGAIAGGATATAIGNNVQANGTGSVALGVENIASGAFAQSFGNFTTAPSGFETVFGYYNTPYTPANASTPKPTDRLFVIGNGSGPLSNLRSDALIILKNGSTRINGPLTLGISSSNLTSYTLPNFRGSDGQVLQTNGSGVVSWADVGDNLGNHIASQNIQLNGKWLSGNGGSSGLRVANNGYVGIGIANPTADLNIVGENSAKSTTIRIENLRANGWAGVYLWNNGIPSGDMGHNGPSHALNPDAMVINNYLNSPLLFINNGSERMRIQGNGNIGIGTNNPTALLHINGATRIDGTLNINGNYSLPTTAGTNGQVLTIDGVGNTSWTTSLNTDDQTIDVLNLNNNTLEISLENDGQTTQSVNLSAINTDDQTIDYLNLNNNTLEVSLENDGQPPLSVDLSSLAVPVGAIMMWTTATPPDGWILCNGQSLSSYPDLAAVLGTSNAPDLTDKFPYGAGTNRLLGQTGGSETRTLSEANIPKHSHGAGTLKTEYKYKSSNSSAGASSHKDGSDVQLYDGDAITGSTDTWGGGSNGFTASFEIIPPFVALNFIIKAE